MASDTYRSDPRRAAELACILTLHASSVGATVRPHILADAVAAMQKAARAAKRESERACDYGYASEAAANRAVNRTHKAQARLNAQLVPLFGTDNVEITPTVELGGDPRGPCARLHIPGQRGDGWGGGFAIY